VVPSLVRFKESAGVVSLSMSLLLCVATDVVVINGPRLPG
jgi:hypothetical protein